ncbi:hypothetical protein Bbelb_160180 [Branchiostoma belcheri]|nr:hypothetical protein Bbelb_160180 [Branchiostoma belcheri]
MSDARDPYVPYGRSTCEYGLLAAHRGPKEELAWAIRASTSSSMFTDLESVLPSLLKLKSLSSVRYLIFMLVTSSSRKALDNMAVNIMLKSVVHTRNLATRSTCSSHLRDWWMVTPSHMAARFRSVTDESGSIKRGT